MTLTALTTSLLPLASILCRSLAMLNVSAHFRYIRMSTITDCVFCFTASHKNKLKSKFNFLGRFIAKAVLDNRMVSPATLFTFWHFRSRVFFS